MKAGNPEPSRPHATYSKAALGCLILLILVWVASIQFGFPEGTYYSAEVDRRFPGYWMEIRNGEVRLTKSEKETVCVGRYWTTNGAHHASFNSDSSPPLFRLDRSLAGLRLTNLSTNSPAQYLYKIWP